MKRNDAGEEVCQRCGMGRGEQRARPSESSPFAYGIPQTGVLTSLVDDGTIRLAMIDGRKRVPFWYQTMRRTRCVSKHDIRAVVIRSLRCHSHGCNGCGALQYAGQIDDRWGPSTSRGDDQRGGPVAKIYDAHPNGSAAAGGRSEKCPTHAFLLCAGRVCDDAGRSEHRDQ